jgi:RimJ/RimL family protein N-acetyltransferase
MLIPTTFGGIRPWTANDLDALVRHANNRNVACNLRDAFPHPYTTADGEAFLALVAQQSPTTFFAIATADEAIGGIGVSLGNDVHRYTAELGYWLAECFWGKGMMTEAVAKFTEFAMDRFELVRIYAEPFATNESSRRVLEKSGFEFEGRLRSSVTKEGQLLDQLLYSRIRQPAR